eukprot:142761-Hanusia_phi.AAC.1
MHKSTLVCSTRLQSHLEGSAVISSGETRFRSSLSRYLLPPIAQPISKKVEEKKEKDEQEDVKETGGGASEGGRKGGKKRRR